MKGMDGIKREIPQRAEEWLKSEKEGLNFRWRGIFFLRGYFIGESQFNSNYCGWKFVKHGNKLANDVALVSGGLGELNVFAVSFVCYCIFGFFVCLD